MTIDWFHAGLSNFIDFLAHMWTNVRRYGSDVVWYGDLVCGVSGIEVCMASAYSKFRLTWCGVSGIDLWHILGSD